MKAKKAKKTTRKLKAINLEVGTSVDVADSIGEDGVSMIGVEVDSEAEEEIVEDAEGSMIEADVAAGAVMTGEVAAGLTGEVAVASTGVAEVEIVEVEEAVVGAETDTPGVETGVGSTKEGSMIEKVLWAEILKTRK